MSDFEQSEHTLAADAGVPGAAIAVDLGLQAELPVYIRLGHIIRSLHDALREIGADHVISEAASEFPYARDRLLHIASLTEKAANTVLSKVEESHPVQDKLVRTAAELGREWDEADQGKLEPEDLKALEKKTRAFMLDAHTGCLSTYEALSDIMMAQDFQDLTGQLIKKVVALLEGTEKDLLKLLIDAAPPEAISVAKKEDIMAGPGAPGGVALEQAGVDDLLADLGF